MPLPICSNLRKSIIRSIAMYFLKRLLLFLLAIRCVVEATSTSPTVNSQEFVFYSNQVKGLCLVPTETTKEIFNFINTHREEGIVFNPDKIVERIQGGICSAISLSFALAYAELRQAISPDDPLFIDHLAALGYDYGTATKKLISHQLAFNTIEVVKGIKNIDYARNKVQSLANLYGLQITYASKVIDIENRNREVILKSEVEQLAPGIYLIRTLEPANNEKLEIKGHSNIYIKEKNVAFLYEPNKGLSILKPPHHEQLLQNLCLNYHRFHVHLVRFYKLENASTTAW